MKTNLPSHFKFTLIVAVLVLAAAGGLIPQRACAAPGDLFASVNGTTGKGGGSVFQYAPDGTQTTFISNLDRPRGVTFDNSGNFFVATTTVDNTVGDYEGTIFKITPGGMMSTFATGFGAGFFLQGLVTDSAGNVFVMAENNNDPNFATTIYKVTPDGAVSPFGFNSSCSCSVPGDSRAPAFDSSGNLYVPDSSFQTIYKFTPEGVQSIFVGPPATVPAWIAFDSLGNLFGSIENPPFDTTTSVILKFTPDGTASQFATGLANPRGLAFDSAGNVFVADIPASTTGNILKFTPGGIKTVFASGIGQPQGNGGPEYLAFQPGAVAPAPAGSNVTVNMGAVGFAVIALTFPQVTAGGTTTVTPIDPNSAGTLPSGYELTGGNLAFEITMTAAYTTPIIIAFQVPSIDATTFSQLRVLHNEGGTLLDVTATNPPPDPVTQTIYASVSSLSPFVIAKDTVTFDSLIALTRQSVTNSKVMYGLVAELTIAKNADARGFPKIEDLALKVYIKLVSLVRGKFITPQNAAILISEARTL